jgi:hypothetical protein
MPSYRRQLIDAPTFAIATGCTGLTAVKDTVLFKGIITDAATALRAYLIRHFHFLLFCFMFLWKSTFTREQTIRNRVPPSQGIH